MTWSVYQQWDPLRCCIVGQTYPPDLYHWIENSRVRQLFEQVAIETEEDYQCIIKKLAEFNVTAVRPEIPETACIGGNYLPPPSTPQDYMIMIGQTFYKVCQHNIKKSYNDIKDPSWPGCNSYEEFLTLPQHIQTECNELHHFTEYQKFYSRYDGIFNLITQQGNKVVHHPLYHEATPTPSALITRVGKDLYFGTESHDQKHTILQSYVDSEFTDTRNHIVDTGGHRDGMYCAVCPGLIISLNDASTYATTFPGWEVVHLPDQSWDTVAMPSLISINANNKGKWFKHDQSVINFVESWLTHWCKHIQQTVFDINMLVIDTKNVIVFNYNKQVFDALDRYGITPHIVPFRHRYFWDGGIHCITTDLHREGSVQDYFPKKLNDV